MQTFIEQFYVNQKTLVLVGHILFPGFGFHGPHLPPLLKGKDEV